MKIHTHTISTKKGDSQTLRWLVLRDTPLPDIHCQCGSLDWRNGDTLFNSYGRKATGIPEVYECHLLTPDGMPTEENWCRTMHASYEGRPGGIVFRGKTLGQTEIWFRGVNDEFPTIHIGRSYPGKAEADLFREQIIPTLRLFIRENRGALKASAERRLANRFTQQIEDKRKELIQLREKADAALYLANKAE